ncbi:AAA family ATPase [Georgenia sp. AZ-5]|uniref:AAA family ATPase n=1 Tax=Georgenia sp. AZ-5 TaxID=3367526 RepID=UPI0037549598
MRIHRLTLQAIGPFPDRHTVDFDALSTGGLFLLEGPTGSGKSTLIDAVVFALYGTVAGAEASDDRLHSDHAAADVEPFVDLTFSTAAGVYRVWRSPKFLRPKKRGDGFTPQNARAKLWRLADPGDGAGEPVSAHVQEVGGELSRIVVLDREQFTQTVVLPQGQFASFLRARPEDRRAVLQDVFGTEVYERLQKQLADTARSARADVERAGAQIGSATAAFVRAARLEEAAAVTGGATATGEAGAAATGAQTDAVAAAPGTPDHGSHTGEAGVGVPAVSRAALVAAAEELDGGTLTEHTGAVLAAVAAAADAAATAESRAATVEADARASLDAERTLARVVERRATLLAEQETLTARAPDVEAAAERLDLARRASTVAGALHAHAEAAEAAAGADTTWRAAVAAAGTGRDADLVAGSSGGTDVDALRAAHEAATAEQGALAELVRLEAELPRREVAVSATARSIETEAEALAEQEALHAARPGGRAAIEQRLGAARAGAADLPAARADLERAADVLRAATQARVRTAELAEAQESVAAAAARALAAVDAEHAVRRRWVEGVAGELAAGLQAGHPCAVCGATEHPSPAVPAPDHASAEEVEAAASAREQASAAVERERARATRLNEQLEALREAAQGLDVDAARAALGAAGGRAAAADDAAAAVTELEAELVRYEEETAELGEALAEGRSSLAVRRERLAAVREQLAADRERCAAGCCGEETVAARADVLAARAATAHALLEARRAQLGAADDLRRTTVRLAEALAEAGFADAGAARTASLPAATMAALERTVLEHRAALARVAAGLAEPAVAALTGTEAPDVVAAEEAHRRALDALGAAGRRATEARLRAEQVRAARGELLAALGAHAERTARAAPLLRTANLATAGDGNQTATTLATYVLLRRFEDVVAAANDRLATMSDGRYELERIDEKEGGQRARKAGLGLCVRDHVTETPRDPHTLSGGETFYVSLCLALGLADVVRSEAGGVELGTLFVDEGFGSLDPSTLDAVMAELGRLRDGGRAVGIVSHVTELKDRIAERIEIRRLPTGASTLRVRC